jgi:hypothetical protein
MEKNTRKSRRWRPRFGIRSLLCIPVLIAIYFALGAPTKTLGVRDVGERLTRENRGNQATPNYKAPLVLEFSVMHVSAQPGRPRQLVTNSSYYFWFFGLTAELPFTNQQMRDLPPPEYSWLPSSNAQ